MDSKESFPWLRVNKKESFKFLEDEVVSILTNKIFFTIFESSVMTNCHHDLLLGSPSNHEEDDARMLFHAKDVRNSGIIKVSIPTEDTGIWNVFKIKSEWIIVIVWDMETFRNIAVYSLSEYACMPIFHAFIGFNKASLFGDRGKIKAWNAWDKFNKLTAALSSLSNSPSESLITCFLTIEQVALLYDREAQYS